MNKNIDFRIGLSEISYLKPGDDVQHTLPEKTALPALGEAISSHFDALWQVNQGQELVAKICSLSEQDLSDLGVLKFYNIASDSLAWLEQSADALAIDADVLNNAKAVLTELAELETALNISRKLLVQS